jgi:hypothetical protein
MDSMRNSRANGTRERSHLEIGTLVTTLHIVEDLTTGQSDIIAPVGVTSLWRYRVIAPIGVTRRIICDVPAELWVLNFWIKFATIRAKNASKYSHLVSCDKQKMAVVCVFWVEIWHSWFSCPGNPGDRRYFHSKNTRVWFSHCMRDQSI